MTNQDKRKVAAFANVDVRTIERALSADGATRVRSAATRAAIVKALRDLDFKAEAARLDGGT